MPLSQKMLIYFSPYQLAAMFIVVFVGAAVLGVALTRRLIPLHELKVHNEVAGPIFGVIGTIYAVMLAFVVVITWQSHDMTKQHVDSEVSGMVSLFVAAEGFKEPMKTQSRQVTLDYAESIAREEWKSLKVGVSSPITASVLFKLMKLYGSYEPSSKTEEICLAKSMDKMSELVELRRRRQLDSREGIHPMLWIALIAGGFITICMSCLFGTESPSLQVIMTVSLAIMIALVLFTIVELDFPFTGKMGLSPVAFEEMVGRLKGYLSS